jgi:hypothetical protein
MVPNAFSLSMTLRFLGCVAALALAAGCVRVSTDPIEVRPIQINVDVNVRVDRALDDFFGELDRKSATLEVPAP